MKRRKDKKRARLDVETRMFIEAEMRSLKRRGRNQ